MIGNKLKMGRWKRDASRRCRLGHYLAHLTALPPAADRRNDLPVMGPIYDQGDTGCPMFVICAGRSFPSDELSPRATSKLYNYFAVRDLVEKDKE